MRISIYIYLLKLRTVRLDRMLMFIELFIIITYFKCRKNINQYITRLLVIDKHLYTIIHELLGVWDKLDIGSQELA